MNTNRYIFFVLLLCWTFLAVGADLNLCSSVNRTSFAERVEVQYCAGNYMSAIGPANNRLALDQSNGDLYYGYIGGLQVVNSDSFQVKQIFNFSNFARFQNVDLLRKYAWLVTAQGVASIDLEDPRSPALFSSLEIQGNQYCPGDFNAIDELGGNAYSICVNGSQVAFAVQINISDRKATVKNSMPITQLEFQQSVINLSPDRRRSVLYVVKLDYNGLPLEVTAIKTADMSFGNAINIKGLGINSIIGADDSFFYTLETVNSTNLIVAKRDINTMKLVLRSTQILRTELLKSYSIDIPSGQLSLWHDMSFILYDFNLNNIFKCQRLPIPSHPCKAWRVLGNSMLWKQNNFFSLQCMDDNNLFVSRSLLSPNDGCPNHCSLHGQCVADECYCAGDYSGKDCSKSKNVVCGRECQQDSDCWNGDFWNVCVVCYQAPKTNYKSCQQICTAPCSQPGQCAQWGTHTFANQCAHCNRQFRYCMAEANQCGQLCRNDDECASMECPKCTVNDVMKVGTCYKN